MKIKLLTIVIFLFFLSCSKDNSQQNINTLILGKWNAINYISWWTQNNGTMSKDTTNALAGSYIDYRDDGKVYSLLVSSNQNNYDTSNYQIEGKYVISWHDNTSKDTTLLDTLTNNKQTLYSKTVSDLGVFERWENYSR